MTAQALERGGLCVSPTYVDSNSPLLWECSSGHRWSATAQSIRKGSWCPECAGVRRGTISQMENIASARGGKCLSQRYCNTATKLRWRCLRGHEWNATPLHVKNGHWCPFCARVAPLTLTLLQEMAARKSGKCLSVVCENSWSPIRWKCAAGHEWSAPPRSIRAGTGVRSVRATSL